jgi:hypothetical protein
LVVAVVEDLEMEWLVVLVAVVVAKTLQLEHPLPPHILEV